MDHKIVLIRRQLGTVGMQVSSDNIWVASPPCSGLSDVARKVRINSAEWGRRIVCSRADQHKF
eukprot:12347809-Prorocentrum_lima.AAC.1